MGSIKTFIEILMGDPHSEVEHDMRIWRKRICDAVFYFFSIFGFFTYIPSLTQSIREGYYQIAVLSSLLYLACLCLTFIRRIDYLVKAVIGAILFFAVGVALLYVIGPRGASEVWLFATTILVALLLGNRGAIVAFGLVSFTQIVFYFLLRMGLVPWNETFGITPGIWILKGINFILLNFVIVIANAIFVKGFRTLVERSTETKNASIIGLAKLAEYRDSDTGLHLKRLQGYAVLLAQELSKNSKYQEYITDAYIQDLHISSILHDIGKVGIQDSTLLKPGPLSEDEFEAIKQHPVIGGNVIAEIEKNIHGRSFYTLGKEIALYHHEKWDGSGYPEGLRGDAIPLSARITALADVYDALTSDRPYKVAISHHEALEIIKKGRGSQFDPEIVDAFIRIAHKILGLF